MKLLDHFSRNVDEEYSQAMARTIIAGVALAILGVAYGVNATGPIAPAALLAYLLFSLAWAAYIKLSPGRNVVRRTISMLGDFGIVSFTILNMGAFGAFFYPLYLWVIVGNGMRFGEKYLLGAMVMGITGFSIIIFLGEYWRLNLPAGLGLLSGLVILPIFYLVLIRRLHTLNDDLARELEQSYYAASHDALTGLVNRAYYFERFDIESQRAIRYNESFAVMFIDLDNFKQINDNLGHQAGDHILTVVAERLRELTRKVDIVARLGGDEFTILFPALSGCEDIETVSRSVIESLSRPIEIDGTPQTVTASIGISVCPQDGKTADELIYKADIAMYQSKDDGKNKFTVYA
jgi:diguanylate cyclase (GGDEF)-like protein